MVFPLVIEAEQMTATVGGPTASGWNIHSDGCLSETLTLCPGALQITVVASSDYALGEPARMVVRLADEGQAEFDVSANHKEEEWEEYTVNVLVSELDRYPLTVEFINAYYAPGDGEDRNLLVDKVVVTYTDQ